MRGSAVKSLEIFKDYPLLKGVFDEYFKAKGKPHPWAVKLVAALNACGKKNLLAKQLLSDSAFHQGGITFTVYHDNQGLEKTFPFDIFPRVIPAKEWREVEAGVLQRTAALNAFLRDIYSEQLILKDKKIPKEPVLSSKGYLKQVQGIEPKGGVYIHIGGIDLIRNPKGELLVLEDNVRCPSGVSYVLENRQMMKRFLPKIFPQDQINTVEYYPLNLRSLLCELAQKGLDDEPTCVVLTPGPYNSAYYEHSFLARRMGCELVQAQDLFVKEDQVFMKTTQGPKRVDVIYRRVDDLFIDPEVFNEKSLLGVKGLVRAYAKNNVVLANAIGNGVADDKAIYPYVPDMIRYYLKEEPILNQVPTYHPTLKEERSYILDNLDQLVVKEVNGSGGCGMLFGPRSTHQEQEKMRQQILEDPRNYIAQPVVELSSCPSWEGEALGAKRVDLRPFILTGQSSWVLPGGLTRVALSEGSYIVNSSQGGGSKDTWVLKEES